MKLRDFWIPIKEPVYNENEKYTCFFCGLGGYFGN